MDLRTNRWCQDMLECLENPEYRETGVADAAADPRGMNEPIGPLADHVALDAGSARRTSAARLPDLDDQAAGLVGGGAVDAGQVAVILGNSAVVNSSAATAAAVGHARRDEAELGAVPVDALLLERGPVPRPRRRPEAGLGRAGARPRERVPPGCDGTAVLPFVLSEPSLGVTRRGSSGSPASRATRACGSGRRSRRSPT